MKKKSGTKPSTAVIVTVLNEAAAIEPLLNSLQNQTLQPHEIIVADGGSTDSTIKKLEAFAKKHPTFPLRFFTKKGNRSVGRNFAIKKTSAKLIAITDAGCVPDKNWLRNLVKKQTKTKVDVIAGYYRGISNTPFEEAVIPYTLVMPDKVNPEEFLPATRSMLLTRNIWQEVGGFNEALSDNEDYAFAQALKKHEATIAFAQNAVVTWQPRSNLKSFYTMIYRFARGDVFAGIIRPKVLLIFLRYLFGILLVGVAIFFAIPEIFQLLISVLLLYFSWAIYKNYRYVPHGWYWLPILQLTSDIAVMHGSIAGFLQKQLTT